MEAFLGNDLINTGGNRVEGHLVLRIVLTVLCKLVERKACQAETARHLRAAHANPVMGTPFKREIELSQLRLNPLQIA